MKHPQGCVPPKKCLTNPTDWSRITEGKARMCCLRRPQPANVDLHTANVSNPLHKRKDGQKNLLRSREEMHEIAYMPKKVVSSLQSSMDAEWGCLQLDSSVDSKQIEMNIGMMMQRRCLHGQRRSPSLLRAIQGCRTGVGRPIPCPRGPGEGVLQE